MDFSKGKTQFKISCEKIFSDMERDLFSDDGFMDIVKDKIVRDISAFLKDREYVRYMEHEAYMHDGPSTVIRGTLYAMKEDEMDAMMRYISLLEKTISNNDATSSRRKLNKLRKEAVKDMNAKTNDIVIDTFKPVDFFGYYEDEITNKRMKLSMQVDEEGE